MTIRMMMFSTAWISVLVAATVGVFNSPKQYLWIPSLVCWSMFGLFCMFAATLAMLPDERNKGFWIGAATFGTFYLLAVMLADALYQPTIGRVVSDVIVFNIDRDSADEITRMRCDSLRNMADVGIATVLTVAGGVLGRIHNRSCGG